MFVLISRKFLHKQLFSDLTKLKNASKQERSVHRGCFEMTRNFFVKNCSWSGNDAATGRGVIRSRIRISEWRTSVTQFSGNCFPVLLAARIKKRSFESESEIENDFFLFRFYKHANLVYWKRWFQEFKISHWRLFQEHWNRISQSSSVTYWDS